MRVVPQSQNLPLFRARANSSTDASYPSRVPTLTIPSSNDGVVDLSGVGMDGTPTNVVVVPFGQGVATNTIQMKVLGWKKAEINGGAGLWVPIDLWEGTCTLGSTAGVGSTLVAASTLAAAMNGLTLPQASIALASAVGFAATGQVQVRTSLGPCLVNYSGVSGNTLTGCNLNAPDLNGNGGTLSTGGTVQQTGYGQTGTPATTSDLFATSISTTVGNAGADCDVVSPGGNNIAHLMLDAKGCWFLEFLFNLNSSATQANALVGGL